MVTDKNTKQEILDEYKKLLATAKNSGLSIPKSASGLNTKNNKADILSAIVELQNVINAKPSNNAGGVLQSLGNVLNAVVVEKSTTKVATSKENKNSPKKEDNDLSYLNQEIIEKIHALDSAKALKKKEYENILAIEQELIGFVAMINNKKKDNIALESRQKDSKALQEEKIQQLQDSANEDIQIKLDTANEKLAKTEEDILKDRQDILKGREVEEEAYSYKVTKAQREEDDAWSDEVARREDALSKVEAEIAELQSQIDSKAELVAQLTAKIDEIPTLIEQAKINGAEQKEKELGKDYGYKTTMAKKDAEATMQSLNSQIDNLKEDYNSALLEKQSIQEKLYKAYDDSNKLYAQTVQSTSGIKILSNSDKN